MWLVEVQVAKQRYTDSLREAEQAYAWKAAHGFVPNRNAGLKLQLERAWQGSRRGVGQTVIRMGRAVAGSDLQPGQVR